jgi:outer membrane protein TolC
MGGKLDAMSDAAKARYKKMLAAYEKSIQIAFKETLDSLISTRKNREIVVSRTRQVNALKKSYQIAKIQKESGLIGMLDLLDVERGLLAAEMELASALQNQLNAVVDLCKALGGGLNIDKLKNKL